MAFSKTVVEDKIEVMTEGQLQVRTKTTVLEDSVVLSHSHGQTQIFLENLLEFRQSQA